MKTTFVFGAGASIHAGYPLASKMGEKLLNFMIKHPHDLSRHYGQLIVDAFGKSPNIEDLITEIDARIESLRKEGKTDERRVWGNARGWFAVMLREWFRKRHKSLQRTIRILRSESLNRGYGHHIQLR